MINDLLAALGPKDYAKNYVGEAFGNLLSDVAAFAQANGLSGKDVLVSGHSLGGLAVNSLADLSSDKWSGFYQDSNYIAYASPTQSSTYPSKFCETESISEYGDAVLALRKPCDEKRKAAELLVIAPASGKESALRLAPGEPVFAATNLGQWFVVSRDAAGKLSLNMGAIDGGTHFSHTSVGVEHSLHISRIKIDQKGERSFEYAYEQRAGECRFNIAGHAAEVDVFNPQGKDGKEGPQIVMYDGEGATLTLPHVGPPRQVYFDSVLSPEQLKRSCGNIKGGKLALVFNEAGVRR